MTRFQRIAVELVGPTVVGSLILTAIGFFSSGMRGGLTEAARSAMIFLLFAPKFCGIQSILYSVVMEVAFGRGLEPRSAGSVALSTLLGCLSGASAVWLLGERPIELGECLFLGGLGTVVGLAIGLLFYAEGEK